MTWGLTLALVLAITGAAAIFVAWPLLMGRTRPEEFFGTESNEPVIERLMFQKDTTSAAMKELDLDRVEYNIRAQSDRLLCPNKVTWVILRAEKPADLGAYLAARCLSESARRKVVMLSTSSAVSSLPSCIHPIFRTALSSESTRPSWK